MEKLRVARFRFEVRATTETLLPVHKGSTLRGGFGAALRKTACLNGSQSCERCLLRSPCPYTYLFDTAPPADSVVLRNYGEVPRPFVIEPDLDSRTIYRPGDTWRFDFLLIGNGINYLPYVVLAFRQLGKMGVGRDKDEGKGRYELAAVHAVDIRSQRQSRIYSADDEVLHNSNIVFSGRDALQQAKELPGDHLSLHFVTPTRLVFNDRLVERPEFHIVVRALLRRISSLGYFHCGEEWDYDFKGAIAAAQEVRTAACTTRWVDWERYSGRQQTRMKLGGFVGRATYQGVPTAVLPLLRIGELVHVGKACTFGNGQYRLEGPGAEADKELESR